MSDDKIGTMDEELGRLDAENEQREALNNIRIPGGEESLPMERDYDELSDGTRLQRTRA